MDPAPRRLGQGKYSASFSKESLQCSIAMVLRNTIGDIVFFTKNDDLTQSPLEAEAKALVLAHLVANLSVEKIIFESDCKILIKECL